MAEPAALDPPSLPAWRVEAAERVDSAALVASLDRCQSIGFGPKLAEFYGTVEQLHDGARAYLGLIDRYYLLVYRLRRHDLLEHGQKGARWLFERCREVENDPDDHLDLWAREHYKSSLITFGGVAQEILRDPELTIGLFSFNNKEARKPLRQIKTECETNEELVRIYQHVLWGDPKREAPKWSEQDGLIFKRLENPKEPSIGAYGLVDGMPTGSHFGLRVYDDVVTRESVTTPEMIKKVSEARELSESLARGVGREWNIGTRYHFGDTYGQQLDKEILKPRIHPATANGRLDGEPVFFSVELWEQKKRKQPTQVAAQLLQNPLMGKEQMFSSHWFRGYFCRPHTLNIYITADPSKGSPNRRSDRTAMAVTGVDSNGNKYLLDGFCHRMNLSERWVSLKHLHQKWTRRAGVMAVRVGYEQYGMLTDIEHFKEKMTLEKYHFNIEELGWTRDHTRSKEDRMERLVPDFELTHYFMPLVVKHSGTDCLWHVDEDGLLHYRPLKGEPKEWATMKGRGQAFRNIGPIVRKNEDNESYDVTVMLHQELLRVPFSDHDDLTDACSRVYDLEPVPPMIVDPEIYDPPVYVDT